MTYEDGETGFREVIEEAYELFQGPPTRSPKAQPAGSGALVVPGVGAYKHRNPEQTLRQLELCRGGFAVFSYSSLYVSPDETRQEDGRLCRARREALGRWMKR
jgi:hypothetical protein